MIYEFVNKLRRRLQYGDLLLLFYFIVFVRQYAWGLNTLAGWILTIPIALVAWTAYVATKEEPAEHPEFSFWLIVAIPLVFVYLLRVSLPDSSFDVWTLRLFHSERTLRGFLYWPGEFFPTSAPYNPTPDMLTGIFRHVLGYRLGTIVNLLALLWVAVVVDRLLRPHVNKSYLRSACVLLVVLSEHLLFEINNFMVDLLALPLMLEATLLTLKFNNPSQRLDLVRIAFLLGASVALKLTNVVMILPIIAICSWRVFVARPFDLKRLMGTTFVTAVVFFAPLLPFMLYVYQETGSPVFPGYNNIFQSSLYPLQSGWDGRWGPYGPWEILAWPIVMVFEPNRLSELGVYSGRLALGFIAAMIAGIVLRHRIPFNRICFIIVLTSLLWSITMGYIRYALFVEVLAGVLLVMLASLISNYAARHSRVLQVGLLAPVAAMLIIQAALACIFIWQTEWSLRPTVFHDPARHAREAKYLLRDRSIRALLSTAERELFDRVEVWVVSGEKTAGLMPLLNSHAPVINVRTPEYFITPAGRRKYEIALLQFAGRRMYSFTLPSDFATGLFELRFRGLETGTFDAVEIPFYSPSNRVLVYFFEVHKSVVSLGPPERSAALAKLPSDGFRAEISLLNEPKNVRPGQPLRLFFRVRNNSHSVWPSLARAEDNHLITLRARWLKASGVLTTEKESGTRLSYDIAPNEVTPIPIMIDAPHSPGDYFLEADMFQEGVGAFSERGSEAMRVKVRVAQ